jgi:hypothetical protein
MSPVATTVAEESVAADAVSAVRVAAVKRLATVHILANMLASVAGEPAMIRYRFEQELPE